MQMDLAQFNEMDRREGGFMGYTSDMLVKDNTRDPLTGKYML